MNLPIGTVVSQNKDGSFTDYPAGGTGNVDDGDYGMGVAVGDYDNDGYPISTSPLRQKHSLSQQRGRHIYRCHAKAEWGRVVGQSPPAFFDYDNDGHLDRLSTPLPRLEASQTANCRQ